MRKSSTLTKHTGKKEKTRETISTPVSCEDHSKEILFVSLRTFVLDRIKLGWVDWKISVHAPSLTSGSTEADSLRRFLASYEEHRKSCFRFQKIENLPLADGSSVFIVHIRCRHKEEKWTVLSKLKQQFPESACWLSYGISTWR